MWLVGRTIWRLLGLLFDCFAVYEDTTEWQGYSIIGEMML